MLDTLISHAINVLELHYLSFPYFSPTLPYHLLPLAKVCISHSSPLHGSLVVLHLDHLDQISKVILEASQQDRAWFEMQ